MNHREYPMQDYEPAGSSDLFRPEDLDEILDRIKAEKNGDRENADNTAAGTGAESAAENDTAGTAENGTGTSDANPSETQESDKKKKKSKKKEEENEPFNLKNEIISWIQVLLTAAAIAFVINNFIIANSQVPTGSMENTIMPGDRVIGSRLSYQFGEPERGDIAIFYYPDDEARGIKTYYVKRIIGMPGDTIDIIDGKVYLNGSEEPLDEPYIREEMMPEPPMHYEVPEDCYFMMGDNRNYSNDSRRWNIPFVKEEKLVAKVLFQYFPKIQKLE